MLVSIVIPAYNAYDTLARCLAACLEQTCAEAEVIVVDDGSTDDTADIANLPGVRCVRQENRGPAAARNTGAALAQGEFVAFTDADCVPNPDWIERLLAGFDAPNVVAVGGTYGIANPDRFLARMIHEEIRMRHETFARDVDFLGSFNVAYRKQAFDTAGGFDEGFPRASAEDNDLAYRLHDAGGVLRFAPDAAVAHYHPARLGPYLRTQARHGYWRMRLYAKHPRRAKGGDHYAGRADLAAPPLALLTLGLVAFGAAAAAARMPGAAFVAATALLAAAGYGLLRAMLPARLVRRTGDARYALFFVVAALRDVARAFGMIAGIWDFFIRRKGLA